MTCPDVLSRLWTRCKSRVGAYWVKFDLDATDGFFGVDYLMALGGLHLDSDNRKLRSWWNIYRGIIVLVMPLLGWKLVFNVNAGKTLDVILQSAQSTLAIVVILLRGLFTVMYYEQIMVVRCYVNGRYFGRMLESSLRTRAAGFYNVRWVVVLFGLFQLGAACLLVFMDMTQNDTVGLPFDLREICETLQTFLQKVYCGMIAGIIASALASYTTAYMILKGLQTELTVIVKTFEGIMDRAEKSTSTKLDSTATTSRHLRRTRQRFFWKYLHEEFRNCIQLHQEFLDTLAIVKPLLNATFLIVYYSTTLNIAFGTIYLLSTDPSQITVYSCLILYYVGLLMLECWLLTYFVTNLTELNEAIGDAVYGLGWPQNMEFEPEFATHYRSIRNTMSVVMARAGSELRLNCFGFFEFTLEQFGELVNLAYSLVAFFRNFV